MSKSGAVSRHVPAQLSEDMPSLPKCVPVTVVRGVPPLLLHCCSRCQAYMVSFWRPGARSEWILYLGRWVANMCASYKISQITTSTDHTANVGGKTAALVTGRKQFEHREQQRLQSDNFAGHWMPMAERNKPQPRMGLRQTEWGGMQRNIEVMQAQANAVEEHSVMRTAKAVTRSAVEVLHQHISRVHGGVLGHGAM